MGGQADSSADPQAFLLDGPPGKGIVRNLRRAGSVLPDEVFYEATLASGIGWMPLLLPLAEEWLDWKKLGPLAT